MHRSGLRDANMSLKVHRKAYGIFREGDKGMKSRKKIYSSELCIHGVVLQAALCGRSMPQAEHQRRNRERPLLLSLFREKRDNRLKRPEVRVNEKSPSRMS
jgi:hypothetical protein